LDLILRGEKPVYSDDKIVGGTEVTPNSIPSQISLQRGAGTSFSQSCGGSVLSEKTILNAAHCVDGVTNVGIFRVVAGEHDLNKVSGDEQYRSVVKYTKHENYVSSTFENDIALIFLNETLDLSTRLVQPITLPADKAEPSGNLYVTGWGTTSSGGSISNVLLGVEVPYVDDATCRGNYGVTSIKDSMVCAGAQGLDSCQGDSGGPLYAKIGSSEQVGIVSWGQGCALPNRPGVYTQVSYFLSWIETNNKPPQ
jgi:trypsin